VIGDHFDATGFPTDDAGHPRPSVASPKPAASIWAPDPPGLLVADMGHPAPSPVVHKKTIFPKAKQNKAQAFSNHQVGL
jgi:hypothetical protein